MKITTDKLSESNGMVENSLKDMEDLNSKISIINTSINSIFNDIDKQSQITRDFAMQVSDLNESYGILSDTCNSTGSQVYKMGRNIDKCRTDMAKHYSDLTELDWIKIFEVDHFILMWRVYNHVVGFENLRITQLNNPNSCKLGRWMNNISDSHITASSEFRMVEKTHKAIHRNAVLAWEAKAAHNVELAMSYFDKTREAYSQFQDSIQGLMLLLRALGYTSMTEIIPYENIDKDKMKRAI
jgi:hypothetical protein